MADNEFYLGRAFDPKAGKVTAQDIKYDPADLTTVGVEEIRARLLKDAAERAEQDAEDLGDTRSLLGLRKRALELEHLR